MSDWWSRKLSGGGRPAPPQQRTSTPPVPQAAPRPTALPPQYAPQGQVQQAPVQAPQQYEQDPNAEVSLSERLATTNYDHIPAKADGQLRSSGTCPGCGSGNYYTGNAQGGGAHCHDCGYPIVQAGSGLGALGGAGIIAKGPVHQAQSPVYTQQLGGWT